MTVVNTPAKFRKDEVEEAIPGLGAIFERCRQPKPKGRFVSTAALIEALRKLRRELDSDVDPPAYLAKLYADPEAQISREEIAHYKVMLHERVPSTATFFELPGYRRNRDGRLVPVGDAARSWGVDIAPPDAPTVETEVLDEPDDIELDTDTMAEYGAVKRRSYLLWLLLLIPFFLGLLFVISGFVLQFLLGLGGTPVPVADVPETPDTAEAATETKAAGGEAVVEEPTAEPTPSESPTEEPAPADSEESDGEEDATGAPATEEPAAEEPEEVTAAVPDGETGLLKINAYPAATVYIDGQEVGSTFVTIRGVTLAPGAHQIRMVRTTDGHEQTLEVTIAAGEVLAMPFRWTEPLPEAPTEADVNEETQDAEPAQEEGAP